MSEEKKNEVTEEVKEARKLSMEELEEVSGGQIEERVILAHTEKVAEIKKLQSIEERGLLADAEKAKKEAFVMKKLQQKVTIFSADTIYPTE